MFDRYVVIDWSARNAPATGADSIWIAELSDDDVVLSNPPTRRSAADRLAEIIDRRRDERLLIGFDASLGYPSGTSRLLGLMGSPWESTWDLLAELVTDDARNRNNRFEVAAELNRRIDWEVGPFWGCPPAKVGPHLLPTKPTGLPVAEFRLVERRLRSAGRHPASCWQLLGAGSVGSQTLTLLPLLSELRAAGNRDRVAVWPFTTGLSKPDVEAGAVVVAEVWPTLFPIAAEVDHGGVAVKDALQVRTTALMLQTADRGGQLTGWFSPGVPDAERSVVVAEEGWVLGAGWDTHLR